MKKITFIFLIVFLVTFFWQNRVNIVLWTLPKILNITKPVSSEGSSNWQEGPLEKNNEDQRPNIILILADDLGFNDISLYNGGAGDGSLMTPNIDNIALEGVTFKKCNLRTLSGVCALRALGGKLKLKIFLTYIILWPKYPIQV